MKKILTPEDFTERTFYLDYDISEISNSIFVRVIRKLVKMFIIKSRILAESIKMYILLKN